MTTLPCMLRDNNGADSDLGTLEVTVSDPPDARTTLLIVDGTRYFVYDEHYSEFREAVVAEVTS